ncbi:hypothetical protein CBFG_01874 [Clostridiales bacterium 1_7_47FAA]|nr:hypothetical protein CBFG_01874 [Clostridiales bacterium 1_7_47FAA]
MRKRNGIYGPEGSLVHGFIGNHDNSWRYTVIHDDLW